MKKIIYIIFLVIGFSLNINAQTPTPSPSPKSILDELAYSEKVEQKYDRFKNSTQLQLLLQIQGQPTPLIGLSAIFASVFDGEKPGSDTVMLLTMVAVNKDISYENSHGLIFLLDGERFTPVSNKYSAKVVSLSYLGSNIIEQSSFVLFPDDLKKILAAKKIEAQFGNTEFTFKENQLESIRDFYKRLTP